MKTTKKHFELFKKECERWLKFYGITGWDVNFYHHNLGGEMAAGCIYSIADRDAGLVLAKDDFPDEIRTDRGLIGEIKIIAHHEVCELLLSRVNEYAKLPYGASNELIEDARHEIIMRLQSSVYERKGQKI